MTNEEVKVKSKPESRDYVAEAAHLRHLLNRLDHPRQGLKRGQGKNRKKKRASKPAGAKTV